MRVISKEACYGIVVAIGCNFSLALKKCVHHKRVSIQNILCDHPILGFRVSSGFDSWSMCIFVHVIMCTYNVRILKEQSNPQSFHQLCNNIKFWKFFMHQDIRFVIISGYNCSWIQIIDCAQNNLYQVGSSNDPAAMPWQWHMHFN